MGNKFTSFCSCLSNLGEKDEVSIDENNTLSSPRHYSKGLNIKEIQSKLDSGLDGFLDLLSEGMEGPEDSVLVDRNSCLVTGREISGGCVLKYQWIVPAKPSVFIDYVTNQDNRKEYDLNLEFIKLVSTLPSGIKVHHAGYKEYCTVRSRELLTASTMKKLPNGTALFSVSIDSSEIPIRENCIRVDLKVGGYFVEPTPDGCKVTCMSNIDFKIDHPLLEKIARNFSATYIPRMVKVINKNIIHL